MNSLAGALLAVALLAFPAGASAQEREESEAVVLVATAMLNGSSYRRTVILALPTEGDRHVGIVLNRPSRRTLADLFPEHEPSKRVTEPVFFGGPMSQRVILALVRSDQSPGRGARRVMEGLFLATAAPTVDHIIEQWPQQARFYAGNVIWRPGELSEELGDGYWHVMNAHPDLMFRKDTQGLWDELSRFAGALSADAGHAMDRVRSER
jgi:putative transcriptional regulator